MKLQSQISNLKFLNLGHHVNLSAKIRISITGEIRS
jgi:hypothetical protein